MGYTANVILYWALLTTTILLELLLRWAIKLQLYKHINCVRNGNV